MIFVMEFMSGSIAVWKIESLFLIAQSGSFRPFPVRTQTIVESLGILSFVFNNPATEAALAGSQKIPSSFPRILYASIISESDTEENLPLLDSFATIAFSLLTGLPILIAVAIVSGLLILLPSTKGAEPLA